MRSISAHAEEPRFPAVHFNGTEVYLRARGGTHPSPSSRARLRGLSPRTRRNLGPISPSCMTPRSISAHAEEPPTVRQPLVRGQVYLRARGGTSFLIDGSQSYTGLSPRTRRNHLETDETYQRFGSISAHAEEPPARADGADRARVYLRARGGTNACPTSPGDQSGLSPRTRRNPANQRPRFSDIGSISAHAEEPAGAVDGERHGEVYLRARGGTCSRPSSSLRTMGLSPRTRRNPVDRP
ncbi:Hypothetical protein GbCGDNIH1_1629 [Granulibacter bethesdensis CGDNIH1]|uniref:Uncharacterized protein n=1 Tax=Granulibacter bethesdensis (strain ATCC BAA-1260 / CGDNIH1) TaxID=391165 RepID=Q0BRM5_GRABC|nr:Hypothetical protein GbCGDNIH1_1629 [Granulibacter bethesdensis CGDNIH1]APH65063.1 Hypothetical protein GbCGDNIH1I4_1629 [Granulibacter bethesdensis]